MSALRKARRALSAALIVLGLLGLLVPTALGQTSGGEVYVATIDGTIDLGMTPYVKRTLSTAAEERAEAVLLDINTPGGRLDAALSIKDALLDAEVPVIAYVNREAFSAGALIAISANKIYMDEGGVIGAATPVDQEGEAASEKVISAVRSDFRAVAEVRGRDPSIAEAMVDESIAIDGLVEEGKLLTMTTSEALQWGYADGQAGTIEEALEAEGIVNAELVEVEYSLAERFVRFLTNPVVASLLISLGFLGLLAELTSPGFGVPGIAGILLLALFFWGGFLTELSGWEGVALVAIGLALIAVEIILIPGFGVAGILGLIAFMAGLYISLIGQGATSGDFIRAGLVLTASMIMIVVGAAAILTVLPNRRGIGGLALQTSLPRGSGLLTRLGGAPAAGTEGGPQVYVSLLGKRGVAVTVLHPAGVAQIDTQRVDVVSEGGYIEAGTPIEVIADEEYRRVVRAVEPGDGQSPPESPQDGP
ncbi:MAG: ATP-dependent Clp protease proteolytic subunit [Chloroflexota bacterium]|nr:ATP-dependent Clp protease proteolytic subunit [Chloroflexota bacterium]MDE2968996.1 ATP-dependent Clp protease proteolytic subunit [Chloroflexota bacterium]